MSKLPSFAEAATDMVKFISMIGTQHPEYHEEANRIIADFILATVVAAARGDGKQKDDRCTRCHGRGTIVVAAKYNEFCNEFQSCPSCAGTGVS